MSQYGVAKIRAREGASGYGVVKIRAYGTEVTEKKYGIAKIRAYGTVAAPPNYAVVKIRAYGDPKVTLGSMDDMVRNPGINVTVTVPLLNQVVPDSYIWYVQGGTNIPELASKTTQTVTFRTPANVNGTVSTIGVRGVKDGEESLATTFTLHTKVANELVLTASGWKPYTQFRIT